MDSSSESDLENIGSSSTTIPHHRKEKDKVDTMKKTEIKPPTPEKLTPKVKKTATRTSTRVTRPPVPHYSATEQLKAQTHIIEIGDEPQTWKEMVESPEKDLWMKAAKEEMDSLTKMQTWELVPRTAIMSIVKSKWIFKIKYDGNGNVERYKARLVAKGFTQKHGIDYQETFSPVVRFETIRYLFAIAANRNWNVQQMDVKTAFLNGELTETIFMEQPEGFIKDRGKVCLLKKSLYGLKQAPRCWNEKFRNFMKTSKFSQSTADPCLFILHHNNEMVIVALYVDDLVITGDENLITWTKSILAKKFDMKDLGDIKYILGIQVSRDANGIYLSQSTFITKTLEKFSMSDCKPNVTPAIMPVMDQSELLPDGNQYMQAVGSLNYLATRTRPDISYAIGQVARNMHSPTQNDWIAVKRILRYLQGTINTKLKFGIQHSELFGYSDASYAPNSDDRKSTSGYIFVKNGGAVSWRSKKQPIVSLSSMESEYIALADATKEGIWLKRLELDIFPNMEKSILIYEDNQSAIKTAKNEIHNERSKHIDVRYHFIRECVNDGRIILKYCPTEKMVADAFTKPLNRVKLNQHVVGMGLLH